MDYCDSKRISICTTVQASFPTQFDLMLWTEIVYSVEKSNPLSVYKFCATIEASFPTQLITILSISSIGSNFLPKVGQFYSI